MWRLDRDPYGNGVPNEDPDGNGLIVTFNLRGPGEYADVETDLLFNWNRYRDPLTGAFLEADPIGLAGGSFSTYAALNGNPISNVDPDGLEAIPMPAGPLPIIIPSVAIRGTPENRQFVTAASQLITLSSHVVSDLVKMLEKPRPKVCEDNDDFCYQRWEQEDTRCSQWSGLGSRVVAACKVRAADRRNLCVGNGGKPNPAEPPEYNPFVDYPR